MLLMASRLEFLWMVKAFVNGVLGGFLRITRLSIPNHLPWGPLKSYQIRFGFNLLVELGTPSLRGAVQNLLFWMSYVRRLMWGKYLVHSDHTSLLILELFFWYIHCNRMHFCVPAILLSVMCPSDFFWVRVESESQALELESSQSYLKFFRVRVTTWSSRVRVESHELSSRFKSLLCRLESMSSHMKFHVFLRHFFAMKWRPTCYKMAPDKLENCAEECYETAPDQLENGDQCCFNKFDCRVFISKFSLFALYLSLSLLVVSSSLAQCFSTFLVSRPTFRRDFDFGPTSRKICFRTHG